jgi:hypothetical protein
MKRMPQALLLVLGAIGAAIAAKLIAREWRRINDELDQARAKPVDIERADMTNLQRDPVTGVYRPRR